MPTRKRTTQRQAAGEPEVNPAFEPPASATDYGPPPAPESAIAPQSVQSPLPTPGTVTGLGPTSTAAPAPKKKRSTRKTVAPTAPPRMKVEKAELALAPDLTSAVLTLYFPGNNAGSFDIYKLSPEVQIKAAAFGIEAKIRKARDPVAVGKAISEGTWPEGRTRGVNARVPLVVQAVARLTGVTEAVAYEKWKALPDEGPESKKQVRGDQRVKGAIAQIKSEQEQSDLDVSALFAGTA